MDAIVNFLQQTGFYIVQQNPLSLVMLVVSCVLLYLAIVKQFEPLLLLPIAFGMLLTNLPGAGMYHEVLFANGHVQWELFGGATVTQEIIDEIAAGGATQTILDELTSLLGSSISVGLLDVLYLGVKLGVYPCLIFVGVGAMTDFGPLIANPKSLLLGAAAQLGIFVTYIGATLLGFTGPEASSIGIIGGADGPTAIYTTSHLAPHLLGPIAVAAYSYMALVPVIQPPIMKALTTDKERKIKMKQLRPVSKTEKILFPIIVTIFVSFLVPSAASLVGCLMLGNLMRECGVVERLSKTVQNELMNIVTIFLGISVGATAVLIPEREVDFEAEIVEKIRRARLAGRTHFMIIVAEGVEGGAYSIGKVIEEATALDTRVTVLGHIQRGGSPSSRDRITATYMGYEAVRLLAEGKTCRVVALQGENYVDYDITEALQMTKSLDQHTYEVMRALTGVH